MRIRNTADKINSEFFSPRMSTVRKIFKKNIGAPGTLLYLGVVTASRFESLEALSEAGPGLYRILGGKGGVQEGGVGCGVVPSR